LSHAHRKIDTSLMWKSISDCTTIGQALSVMFEHMAEPFLAEDYRTADGKYSVPVFITDYPKDICPLARSNDTDPSICDRFELYIEGRELCNAFQELNNPDEQKSRFMDQLDQKHQDAMDYDADYIEALQHGMPPAIGFGMGIDRLVMLLTNSSSIKEVILFPTMKPIAAP
jgi:lysyl-tRNA synthetase class 2